MFIKVTLVTGVGRALKSQKSKPHFIGYQILKRVGELAYKVTLPASLSNLNSVFYVTHLPKYVPDLSHVIQMDDVQVINNLTMKASPLKIDDREVKRMCW